MKFILIFSTNKIKVSIWFNLFHQNSQVNFKIEINPVVFLDYNNSFMFHLYFLFLTFINFIRFQFLISKL